jgi:hypothetical protein
MSLLGIIMILGAAVSVVFLLQLSQTQPENGDVVLTVSISGNEKNYTMDELIALPSTMGLGGFVKTAANPPTPSGPYNYTGVLMTNLLTDVGNLPENYSLQVLSSDGYATYFTKDEVQGVMEAYDSTTAESIGDRLFLMLLAYHEEGEALSEEAGGPLRIVFIPDGDYMSAGHSWPKFVTSITVIDETDPWSLELEGVESWNMTHDTYYSLGSCPHHRRSITYNDAEYSGVALWTIVSSMDGGQDDHYSFNGSLVLNNYTVRVWSGSGVSKNFTSFQIAYNNSLLIAGWIDDELLVAPEWPLVLITSDGLALGNIIRIEMFGW